MRDLEAIDRGTLEMTWDYMQLFVIYYISQIIYNRTYGALVSLSQSQLKSYFFLINPHEYFLQVYRLSRARHPSSKVLKLAPFSIKIRP